MNLLPNVKEHIIIFIDESDSIRSLDFKVEDFFVLIRTCYNQRVDKEEYDRLNFAILGVASPSDLIQDKKRTPFNIGRAIDLTGFGSHEATPLAPGLADKAENPEAVLNAVLAWTGGQPFLTQKICNLIATANIFIKSGREDAFVAELVKEKVIDNWESQDEPAHLRTIRDRILFEGGDRTARLLGLYQRVLQGDLAIQRGVQGLLAQDTISEGVQGLLAQGTPDEMELRLSGLVVLRDGLLRVYNPIYAPVFDLAWVEKALGELRPYAEALNSWIGSGGKDKSRLLRGDALKDALAWAEGKKLGDEDYRFLTASQKLEQEIREAALEAESQQRLNQFMTIFLMVVKDSENRRTRSLFNSHLTHASLLARGEDYAAAKEILKQSHELDNEIPMERQHARNLLFGFCRIMGGEADKVYEGAGAALTGGVAVSPDGKLIAASGERGTLVLFDAETGKLVKRLEGHDPTASSTGDVRSVVFHPEGKWLASAGDDGRIILWSIPSNLEGLKNGSTELTEVLQGLKKIREWEAPDAVKALAVSPALNLEGFQNGSTELTEVLQGLKYILASGGTDNNITLWNPETGKALQTFKGHTGVISSSGLTFSSTGKYIASISYSDKTARLWDIETDKSLYIFKEHTDGVTGVAFFTEDKLLATGSMDKSIRLWNVETGQGIRVLIGHQNIVFGLRFIPDTSYLVSASFDRTLRVWDTETGVTLGILQGHSAGVVDIALHHYKGVRGSLEHVQGNLALLHEGIALFSASNDGTVRRWDMSMPYQKVVDLPGKPSSTAIAPNGNFVTVGFANGSLRLYALPDGNLLWENEKAHTSDIPRLAFNSDGTLLSTAGADYVAKVWKVGNGSLKELQTFTGHTDAVHAVAFSPDSKTLATASYDGKIGLFTIGTDEKRFIENAHEGLIVSVTFDSSGTCVLSCGNEDRSIRLWNLTTDPPTLLQEFPKAQDMLLWASLSPDDKRIAVVGRDALVHIYNAQDGKKKYRLIGHENTIYRAIFSSDSQQVATVSMDATVRLWDLSNGKELFCLRLPNPNNVAIWDFDFRLTPRGTCLIAVPLTRGKLVLYELNYEMN